MAYTYRNRRGKLRYRRSRLTRLPEGYETVEAHGSGFAALRKRTGDD